MLNHVFECVGDIKTVDCIVGGGYSDLKHRTVTKTIPVTNMSTLQPQSGGGGKGRKKNGGCFIQIQGKNILNSSLLSDNEISDF